MSKLVPIILLVGIFFIAVALKLGYDSYLEKRIKNYRLFFKVIVNAIVILMVFAGINLVFNMAGIPFDGNALLNIFILIICLIISFLLINYFTDHLLNLWKKGVLVGKFKILTSLNYLLKTCAVVVVSIILLRFSGIDLLIFFSNIISIIKEDVVATAACIFIIYLVIAKGVLYVFKTYFTEVVKRTKTHIDDIMIDRLEYPLTWCIILSGFIISFKYTGYNNTFLIPMIGTFIAIIVSHTLIKLTDDLLEAWWEEAPDKINEDIIQTTRNFAKILLIIITFIVALIIWGADIKSLLLSVGVISLILGLALKDSLDNVFSGVSLMLDHTYKVGDVIQLETGEYGEVMHIGLRSTHIKTHRHEILVVPNSVLARMRLLNYARPDKNLKIVIPVTAAYGSNINKVTKVLLSVVKKIPQATLPKQAEVKCVKLGDSGLEFNLVFYIDDYRQRYMTESLANALVYQAFAKNKIDIPFPSRNVYLMKKRRR